MRQRDFWNNDLCNESQGYQLKFVFNPVMTPSPSSHGMSDHKIILELAHHNTWHHRHIMTLPPPSPLGISFHTADSCGVEEKALKMASLTRQSPPSLPLGTSNHRTHFYQFVIRSRAPRMESLTRYDPPPTSVSLHTRRVVYTWMGFPKVASYMASALPLPLKQTNKKVSGYRKIKG